MDIPKAMEQGKKLKILYIITKSNWGGAQRYVFDLATSLPREDFEPVVAFGGNGQLKEKLETAGVLTISILALDRDIGVFKEFRAFANILKVVRDTKPDLIHLNSSKAGILGALAARLNNIYIFLHNLHPKPYTLHPSRVIFTAHGWPFKEKRDSFTKKLLEYTSWLTIILSDKTIVVSRDDLERVSRFLFIKPKVILVHNGINTPHFKERANARYALSEKIGSRPDGKLWIGSIAELTGNKGLDYAIEATKNVPDCCYVIIGGGEDKEKLKKMIEDAALEKKVFLAGQTDNAASLLKAFDIFLLPSLKEGLPYVLLEAGAAGLPVVATNVGGVPEIIDDMKSGIVIKAKRPKEIEEVLKFLIDHPEKRKEFGEQLQKTVEEKFTLERMVRETIKVYTSEATHERSL